MDEHVFLYEYIAKGSRVVIYGLGDIGKNYIAQIKETKWCDIVAISDRSRKEELSEYRYLAPIELATLDEEAYDYIVIAISNYMVIKEVANEFERLEIPMEKVVSCAKRRGFNIQDSNEDIKREGALKIFLMLEGGIGDHIVFLSFYEKLIEICPSAIIDVGGNIVALNAFYSHKLNVRNCYSKTKKIELKEHYTEYDLILTLNHDIYIEKMDSLRIGEQCNKLLDMLKAYISEFPKEYSENRTNMVPYLLLNRAIKRGQNRYLALGGKTFALSHKAIKIELEDSVFSEFENMKLGDKYITLNLGTDSNLYFGGKTQTKVWPKEYYEQLVVLLKETYPEYKLIQLGHENSISIKNVDQTVFGKSLELVKYILANSRLHIDVEGGLVHMATALNTKCVVFFGPTPVEYYGYPENINLVSTHCNNCMGLLKDWYVECCINEEKAECMYEITPQIAMQAIMQELKKGE